MGKRDLALIVVGLVALAGGIWVFETPPDLEIIPETLSVSDAACAVEPRGTVACWGNLGFVEEDGDGGVVRIDGINDAIDVHVSSSNHACALHQDATLSCWGRPDRDVNPPLSQLTDVEQVDGYRRPCARRTDGTVHCVPANGSRTRPTFERIAALDGVVDVAVSRSAMCGLQANGDLQCRGSFETVLRNVQAVENFGASDMCALFQTEPPQCWTLDVNERVTLQSLPGGTELHHVSPGVMCVDLADIRCASLSDGSRVDPSAYVVPADAVRIFSYSDGFSSLECASRADQTVQCWGGANRLGTLGDADNTTSSLTPVTVASYAFAERTQRGWRFFTVGLFVVGIMKALPQRKYRAIARWFAAIAAAFVFGLYIVDPSLTLTEIWILVFLVGILVVPMSYLFSADGSAPNEERAGDGP